MSDRQPKPCPNLKCGYQPAGVALLVANLPTGPDYARFVQCAACGMIGPKAKTDTDALDLWDALPRRKDFHADLVQLVNDIREYSTEQIPQLRYLRCLDRVYDLAANYGFTFIREAHSERWCVDRVIRNQNHPGGYHGDD